MTLVEQLKGLSKSRSAAQLGAGEVLAPKDAGARSPVLLLIGGGMGAGKSTVVHEIMKRCFWSSVAQDAVIVEADAFKEKDVLYKELSRMSSHDSAEVAQLVHESSTQAASSMLVAALNTGRDIIFDGTMSWAPFVDQTITMVRDVHRRRYRLGPSYHKQHGGTYLERYWDDVEDDEWVDVPGHPPDGADQEADKPQQQRQQSKRPYRIELVGVVCGAHLAVMRGMRRAILTGRGVPVKGQLRSHSLFAASVEHYCSLVDHATIYSTDSIGGPPQLIAYKEEINGKLLWDHSGHMALKTLSHLNVDAKDVLHLYESSNSGKDGKSATWDYLGAWEQALLCEERKARQTRLHDAFCREPQSCFHVVRTSSSRKMGTLVEDAHSGNNHIEQPLKAQSNGS
eukprot:SM000103S09514  [mRNA]  locus=s103:396998:399000:+ [translate_table: standard]